MFFYILGSQSNFKSDDLCQLQLSLISCDCLFKHHDRGDGGDGLMHIEEGDTGEGRKRKGTLEGEEGGPYDIQRQCFEIEIG